MGQRVLVIEDDDGARNALGCLLSEEGYAVRTAGSGSSGLVCAQEFEPDIILCDFYLPDINGLQVVKRLRASKGSAFIIVITAGCCGEVEERELRAEADLFLDKPIDLSRLRGALQDVPGARERAGGAMGAFN